MSVSIAARALVAKLDQIENNPSYQGIWAVLYTHGYRYEGPQYAAELRALKKALSIDDPPAIQGPHS